MSSEPDSDLDTRSEPELVLDHHHAELLKTLPPHVFNCAILFDHLELEDHGPAPTLPEHDPWTHRPWRNLMDVLLEENRELWTLYVKNDFCWTMAESPIPIDPHFKAYAIQDFVWLWEYVRQVAVQTVAAPNIPELAKHSKQIYEMYIYAVNWKKTCINHLGIDEQTLITAQAVNPVKDYLDWMKQLGQEGDWLDLHVLMIPCLQGYYDIARLIEAKAPRPLNHKFHKYWVKLNNTNIYAKRLHDWFARNSPWFYQNFPVTRRRWTHIFRKTTLLEMRMFAYFLGKPLPEDPDIPIGPGPMIPGEEVELEG